MSEWTIWRDCLTGCPFEVPGPRRSGYQPLSPFLIIWGCDTDLCVPLLSQVRRGQTDCKSGCSSRLPMYAHACT